MSHQTFLRFCLLTEPDHHGANEQKNSNSGARRTLAAAKHAIIEAKEAAQGERDRLVIGTLGPLTSPFLPQALARFREQHPMIEATALHMSNPLQIESLLEGSIMLGIGYFDLPLEGDEREQLGTRGSQQATLAARR
jgi:DNA-binding transcriptional LysR family regulator